MTCRAGPHSVIRFSLTNRVFQESLLSDLAGLYQRHEPSDHATRVKPLAVAKKGDHHMFRLASSNTAQAQAYGRSGRQAAAPAKIIGAAAIALLASANTFANAAENASRIALEHHACAVVMGLHQPGDLYDTCVRSLNKSLSELDQAQLTSTDRSVCAQQGLKPGTPAFAVCVVNAEQSPANAGRYQAMVPVR
jgi:hypothetical protein